MLNYSTDVKKQDTDIEIKEHSIKYTEICSEESVVINAEVKDLELSPSEPSKSCSQKKNFIIYYPSYCNEVGVKDVKGLYYSNQDPVQIRYILQDIQSSEEPRFVRCKIVDTEEEAKEFIRQPFEEIFPSETSIKPEEFRYYSSHCPYSYVRSESCKMLQTDIELGDLDEFKSKIISNPNFLIAYNNPKVIEKELHYNVLHIAAKYSRPEFCNLVLETIADEYFYKKMYPNSDNYISNEDLRHHLLDFYLNMPDIELNETPLHFACKFGSYEVVKIFLSYEICDLNFKNKYGKDAKNIICDECSNMEPDAKLELKKQIEDLFDESYFVPLWRFEDDDDRPFIGIPYKLKHTDDSFERPYHVQSSDEDSDVSIAAVAGPMQYSQAKEFYKRWKGPQFKLSSLKDDQAYNIRLTDKRKGFERIGRALARDMNIKWTEYWYGFCEWCNFSTSKIEFLEDHFREYEIKRKMPKRRIIFRRNLCSKYRDTLKKLSNCETLKQEVVNSEKIQYFDFQNDSISENKNNVSTHVEEIDKSKISDIMPNTIEKFTNPNCIIADVQTQNLNFKNDSTLPLTKEINPPQEKSSLLEDEMYIYGRETPSEIDWDIFHALENTIVDPELYPRITKWKHLISTKDKKKFIKD